MAAKYLMVASELGLFERLADRPATLDELALATGIPRRTLRITADAMVPLGFLERQGDHYSNRPVAATFLAGRTPADLRPLLRSLNDISYPRWTRMAEAVRAGEGVFGKFEFAPGEQRVFSEAVEATTAGAARALTTAYDFGRHRRLLDLGGGTGSFLAAVLARHGHLGGTLFELPAVVAIARERLAATPLAARVEVVGGDLFADRLPDGHDVVLLANVLHVFSPEHNLQLLRRVRDHVPAGARLLLVSFWTDPTHTEPAFAALVAGEFLLDAGEGDVYSVEEVGAWLGETGWRALEHRPLVGPASLIVAEAVAYPPS
jgi:SAM-dependent methyltransferase